MIENLKVFVEHSIPDDDNEELFQHFNEQAGSLDYNFFLLSHHIKRFQDEFKAVSRQCSKANMLDQAKRFKGSNAHTHISKALKSVGPSAMACIKRIEDRGLGKPKGSFTTNPREVDEELHHVWDPISDGTKTNLMGKAKAVIMNY